MMNKNEKELSDYIDTLNAGMKPKAHGSQADSAEQEKLFKTVRLVRGLKEPELPAEDFTQRLSSSVAGKLSKKHGRNTNRRWLLSAAAALIVVLAVFSLTRPFGSGGVVYAMEKTFEGIKAYHGVLEVVQINAEGNETTQSKLEVWADKSGHYYTRGLEGSQKGLITVNNGQRKWQVQPEEKQVNIFPAFPDPYRFTFELGKEVTEVKNAIDYKVIAEESVTGRKAQVLEVTPKGGAPYRLWLDKETGLPLSKESAMQNSLKYRVTYTSMDFIDAVPVEDTVYTLPAGFSENNTRPEQLVANVDEASGLAGFTPRIPQNIPEDYSENGITVDTSAKIIRFDYSSGDKVKRLAILESKAAGEFKPAATASLGKIGGNTAEVQSPVQEGLGVLGGGSPYAGVTDISSVRWQQEGMEYAVVGNISLEAITDFINSLNPGEVKIDAEALASQFKPEIAVPYDQEVEENDQKSVDAGHSPWRLDPVFVSQVFVSLKISPSGIVGDYPVDQKNLKITFNNGKEAIVEVTGVKTPVAKVYLKRLIRQDTTGIWTVVGYDPGEE